MHDALNRRQAYSTARELRVGVQTAEGAEQVGRVARIEACAVVAEEVCRRPDRSMREPNSSAHSLSWTDCAERCNNAWKSVQDSECAD